MRFLICGRPVEVDGWEQLTTYGRMAAMWMAIKIDEALRETEKPAPRISQAGKSKIIQLHPSVPRNAGAGKEEAR